MSTKFNLIAAALIGLLSTTALSQTAESKISNPTNKNTKKIGGGSSNINLNSLLANPTSWKQVDWSKNNFMDDPSWSPQTKQEKGKNNYILTHSRESSAFGFKNFRQVRWRTSSLESEAMLSINTDVSPESCPNLISDFGKDLGIAIHSNESFRTYFSETNFVEVTSLAWQWTIGETRITASCFGVPDKSNANDTITLIITFEPVILRNELKPAFLLRCTQNLRFTDGDTRPMRDFVFWVSQDTNPKIRNTQLSIIDEKDSIFIDDLRINFTIKSKSGMSSRFIIDRITGQLSGDISEQGKTIATLNGNCSKVDTAAKF